MVVIAKTSSYSSSSDRNPILGNVAYYGRLVDIIRLKYLGGYSVLLFKCEWFDATIGRGVRKDEHGFTLEIGWKMSLISLQHKQSKSFT